MRLPDDGDMFAPMTASRPLPLPHADQRRDLFWEQVMLEIRRNPALVLVGAPPLPVAPDLVVQALATGDVRVVHDAIVEVVAGDAAEPDRRRAHFTVGQIATRKADLEAIGAVVVARQRSYLAGEQPMPDLVAFDAILESLARPIHRRRVAAYVKVARLACGDRELALDALVDATPVPLTGGTARSRAWDRLRR